MNDPNESPLHYLSKETNAKTSDEITRLVRAVKSTSQEFPDYFTANPSTKSERVKKDIFILDAMIHYHEGHLPEQYIDRLRAGLQDLRGKLRRIEK